ncbi:MAG TPA: hypothetical protein VFE31_01635 [Opitutaceae bacterium]|nr:hypothetical protein [Opitutaceae bacterium]
MAPVVIRQGRGTREGTQMIAAASSSSTRAMMRTVAGRYTGRG